MCYAVILVVILLLNFQQSYWAISYETIKATSINLVALWCYCCHYSQLAFVCALQCVAMRCSVLNCVAVCCSVLRCVAVWCYCCFYSPDMVWFYCRCYSPLMFVCALQRIAVCCSVLQCAAVCCSVLQCVAVCCCALHCAVIVDVILQLQCDVIVEIFRQRLWPWSIQVAGIFW